MNRIIARLQKMANDDIIQKLNGVSFKDIGTIGKVTSEIIEENEELQTRDYPGSPGYLGCSTGAIFTIDRNKLEKTIGTEFNDQEWESIANSLYDYILQDPVNNFYNLFNVDLDDIFNKSAKKKFTGTEDWGESYSTVTNTKLEMELNRTIEASPEDFPD